MALPVPTRETVALLTRAARATSWIVTFFPNGWPRSSPVRNLPPHGMPPWSEGRCGILGYLKNLDNVKQSPMKLSRNFSRGNRLFVGYNPITRYHDQETSTLAGTESPGPKSSRRFPGGLFRFLLCAGIVSIYCRYIVNFCETTTACEGFPMVLAAAEKLFPELGIKLHVELLKLLHQF
jgi:hypothetical protein